MNFYDVECVRHQVTLIDCPGFDDASRSDQDVASSIQQHFTQKEGGSGHIDGVLYLHRINAPRFPGSSTTSLRTLRRLCGSDRSDRITLVTTFWDVVSPHVGDSREQELRTSQSFFKDLLDNGATLKRMPETCQGRLEMLNGLDWSSSTQNLFHLNVVPIRKESETAAPNNASGKPVRQLGMASTPAALRHAVSIAALPSVGATQYETSNQRGSTLQILEERLRKYETEASGREQSLRSEFDRRLKKQQDAFDTALQAEKARNKELEALLDQARDTQAANQQLHKAKDRELHLLRKSRTDIIVRAQSAQEHIIVKTLVKTHATPQFEWIASPCDVCFGVSSKLYGKLDKHEMSSCLKLLTNCYRLL